MELLRHEVVCTQSEMEEKKCVIRMNWRRFFGMACPDVKADKIPEYNPSIFHDTKDAVIAHLNKVGGYMVPVADVILY